MLVTYTVEITVDIEEEEVNKEKLLNLELGDSKNFVDANASIFSIKTGVIDITDEFINEYDSQ